MEFHEKLQELRKQRSLTQEELAEALYVSRTAISRWESGRGYPSIDSIKAIATYFSVTIDELLSCDQILTIAEADQKQTANQLRSLLFGLLDCSVITLLFLPFFGQKVDGLVRELSLISLSGAPYLMAAYYIVTIGTVVFGILALALQNWRRPTWVSCRDKISLGLSVVGTLLFTISMQPYPAVSIFVCLIIKVFMLIKWP